MKITIVDKENKHGIHEQIACDIIYEGFNLDSLWVEHIAEQFGIKDEETLEVR